MRHVFAIGCLYVILLMSSCQIQTIEGDQVLAEVVDKKLYLSEVEPMIPENSTAEDSILFQNAYIERWIRESLLMREAEKNLPPDLELEKLVSNYRSSLVLHQYEKSLVENLLDTVIGDEELMRYYEANKNQYLLETVIVRCMLVKLPKAVGEEIYNQFRAYWRKPNEDREQMIQYSNEYAEVFYLNDSIWHPLSTVQMEMPNGAVNERVIRSNRDFQLTNDDYYYFLKILEIKDEKEIAPLTYIEEQATQVILHQRKIALLEKIREDLYDRAVSRNLIKIFVE